MGDILLKIVVFIKKMTVLVNRLFQF
jgi:hypothetical protein